jgi:anthranilate phosphoribosyltransferase
VSALAQELDRILDGGADDATIVAFLERSIGLMHDAEALALAASALRARMISVRAPDNAIDVCGTGGDGAHSLNISTTVTFVVAGAGVPVAKHGNRAMSSKSGAADVLEAAGVTLLAEPTRLAACLETVGVAFLFAQNHHPCMRFVAAARRAFGKRTVFNLLGPLANPCGVRRQLVGVFDGSLAYPMADALMRLGADHGVVVHGAGGLDELAAASGNIAVDVTARGVRALALEPSAVGVAHHNPVAIAGGDASFNATALRTVLTTPDAIPAYRDTVILNATAALLAAGVADVATATRRARASLHDGAACARLDALIAFTAKGHA